MSITSLKEQLDKENTLSPADKDVMVNRAKAAQAIHEALKPFALGANDIITVLTGMSCSLTVNCSTPMHGIAFMLERMSEYYKHHELINMTQQE